VGDDGLVARFGSDEFTILLSSTDDTAVRSLVDDVLTCVAEPVHLPTGERFHPTVSIGVTTARHGSTADALTNGGLEADRLWLEVTETAIMTDTRLAAQTLRELRGMGLHLALDDFGTGYSSLTYLKRFPFETIKIDRGFVSGLGVDPDDTAIVSAVAGLARALGLASVAEGVETPLQLGALRDMGCDYVQGFLLGRPEAVPRTEVATVPRTEVEGSLDVLSLPAGHRR